MKNVTESLAGCVAIIDLKGFSLKEIDNNDQLPFLPTNKFIEEMRNNSKKYDLSDIYMKIWNGSYPELNINKDLAWETFYKSYLQTANIYRKRY